MGVATTRSLERVMAAMGLLREVPLKFEVADDVAQGGVLSALPALLAFGLLRHTRERFELPTGYYPLEIYFLVVSFLALARVGSLEALRYEPPGEWGKLLGLDRVPEVRTLREKLGQLCQPGGRVQQWSQTLSQEWMAGSDEAVGTAYVDGHVRVYHGKLTQLPRRYVARERLCLRGTTDYWVNAMDGQPFFAITQAVDPGLLSVLRQSIIPRLQRELPGQPSAEQLVADPHLSRFTLVCDRAVYSPDFFAEAKAERVAVITYHKFPGADWAAAEFSPRSVKLANGEAVELELAERGTQLSNGLWVREVRQREKSGHQVSVLSTDYKRSLDQAAVALFARWCQENFFKYMIEHYHLDRLVEYGVEPLPETLRVVNPAWRQLDSQVRKETALLAREQAQFGEFNLPVQADLEQTQARSAQKAQLLQSIQTRQAQLLQLKEQRRKTNRHVAMKDLPQGQRFGQLRSHKKHLVDTLKLIAYRAETALVQIVREKLRRWDDARALVRQVFQSAVDLRPDVPNQTLTLRLHRLSTAAHDEALSHLCQELTSTETVYPGTNLKMIYEVVGAKTAEAQDGSQPAPVG
jgi:Transposase protein